jgi:hypothetical protein
MQRDEYFKTMLSGKLKNQFFKFIQKKGNSVFKGFKKNIIWFFCERNLLKLADLCILSH